MKKYRICLVGFAHMHVLDQIKPFLSMPERVEWIGASDIKPMVESEYFESSSRSMNLKLCQEQCGFTRVFEDYRDLLDLKPDLVLVNCENAFHGIIIPEILMRGIHVVVEKPLAYSTEHAMAIARASRIGKADCMINWPTTWQASVRLGQKLVSEGVVGKVYRFQFRNPDSMGPFSYGQVMTDRQLGKEWWHQDAAGGGSLLDYCLPDEMFSQKGKHFRILVGEPVSTDELVECGSWQQRADYVREKAYSLEKKLRAEAKHG